MDNEFSKHKPIIKAASACVWRGDDVLLIQRGSTLGYGRWSLPGGKVEAGESLIEAAHRELFEEAGVKAALAHHVSDFTVETPEILYVISCFTGPLVEGHAVAGSDARAVLWTHWQDITDQNLAPNVSKAVRLARNFISV